jgi:hypothetical protein
MHWPSSVAQPTVGGTILHTNAQDDHRVASIAEDILHYLAKHPSAADSFEGISQWWLVRIRIEEATLEIQRALDRLVQGGLVVKDTLPSGQCLYRRAP